MTEIYNKCNYSNNNTQTSSVLELKIHVSNDIMNDGQYYVKQSNKKIHLF